MTEEDEALEKPKTVKKPRSEAQIAAFDVAKLKRQANSKIRNEQIALIKDKARKMELLSESLAPEPVTKQEPVAAVVAPVPKKKRTKIVYESDSSSEEEEVVVVRKKKSKLALVETRAVPVVLQPMIRFI